MFIEKSEREERLDQHSVDVTELLALDLKPEIITLVIGPDKKLLPCHRCILAFYSEMFCAGFLGKFVESGKDTFALPENEFVEVQMFVAWCYTGNIVLSLNTEQQEDRNRADIIDMVCRLWVLGDQFLAAQFLDDCMRQLFIECGPSVLNASVASFVYDNTTEGSKLRLFIKDLIVVVGPFSYDFELIDQQEWRNLIKLGGDFVLDIVASGGFNNCELSAASQPYNTRNQPKYLQNKEGPGAKEWITTKLGGRSG